MANGQDKAPSPTIEYSAAQMESARTHLEVFAKHCRDYMTSHGELEVCKHTPSTSVLLHHMIISPQGKDVPVTQSMVDLLCIIFQRTDDLKRSSAHKVLRMWPAHYNQFWPFKTSLSNSDREVQQIRDPKSI